MSELPVRIEHLARLARLDVTSEEAARLEADCRRILDMAAGVRELPTDGVEPLTHATAMELRLRPDQPADPLPREEALRGVPEARHGFLLVPKMKD